MLMHRGIVKIQTCQTHTHTLTEANAWRASVDGERVKVLDRWMIMCNAAFCAGIMPFARNATLQQCARFVVVPLAYLHISYEFPRVCELECAFACVSHPVSTENMITLSVDALLN